MKIVALIDVMTVDQDKRFIEYISSFGGNYWHWIDGGWLLTSIPQTVTCTMIRDKINEIAPGKRTLIFEANVPNDHWAGYGPNSKDLDGKNMFTWIRNNWVPSH